MSAVTHGVQRVLDIPLPRPRGEQLETTGDFLELERELRLELRAGARVPR